MPGSCRLRGISRPSTRSLFRPYLLRPNGRTRLRSTPHLPLTRGCLRPAAVRTMQLRLVGVRRLGHWSRRFPSWRLHALAAVSRADLLRIAVAFVEVVRRVRGCLRCLPTVCDMSGISLCRFSGGEGGEARILAAIGGRSSSAASSSCRSRLHPHLTPVRSLSSPYALGCFVFSMLIRPPVSDC